MILVSAIMWGSGYVAVKIALEQGMHPFIISAIRFLIASIIIAIIIRKKLHSISSDTYQKGIILGILLFIAL
jgi:drug/metabolite transporter (DMT)-like permease